ncbi:uncharacterized protein HMPREF1541_04489 [Cyphellophora europaea CBS 101466]|uniref:Zn(2)-C6 fungal-type domain-containing protein n=1 Tax=Cyphellophora europaea (strain CBS 101466) TaxID=1220924 RepID=W2RWQ0_CYPE1|nr:uncharacterized protein HMPREF1541_04489 [Cyphellophora europaea CBS 101466]ETN40213.1 hypothetical protein HMPREF1541_04489 [Cyphellophora europaea CBS 101466]
MALEERVLVLDGFVPDPVATPAPKREFHRKVRSGCATCKKRRVKCDEGRPTCLRCRASGKRCLGYGLNDVYASEKSTSVEPSSLTSSTKEAGNNDEEVVTESVNTGADGVDMIFTMPRRQQDAAIPDFSDISASSSIVPPPDGKFKSSLEKYSHDFFRYWLARYASPRAATAPDLWTVYFPQVAHSVPAVNDAIIACGVLGTAIRRKCSPSDYEVARLASLQHLNASIGHLVKQQHPPTVMVMVAFLLWQADMVQGNFSTSWLHVDSALRISGGLIGQTPDEMAVLQLARDAAKSNAHTGVLEQRFAHIFDAGKSAPQRKAASLSLARKTLNEVIIAQLKLAFQTPNTPLTNGEKQVLLSSLRKLRRELEWLIDRWSVEVTDEDGTAIEHSLLSPYLENVSSGQYTIEMLCIEFARTLPIFLARMAREDLELRQLSVEFIEDMSLHWHQQD